MRFHIAAALTMMLAASGMAADRPAELRDVIGSTHTGGLYCLTDKDYLNEGADELLDMGTRVIKVWFTERPQNDFPFNSKWPKVGSMVDLAKTPYFVKLFSKPFTTYILEAYAFGKQGHYYLKGMTEADRVREMEQFYQISKYLLKKYKGTGKTFILQNWEGDWALTDPKTMLEPGQAAIQGMTDWLNARQDGVDKARKECGAKGVTVAHAAEVNLVARAIEGKRCATNSVIPHTHCDLYSYSAWDTSNLDAKTFREALDYLAKKVPDSKLYGSRNVYIGEYGAPEMRVGGPEKQLEIVKRGTEVALEAGMRYIVYWELYCNELQHKFDGRPKNSDLSGFWLIRPDGTKPPVWDYYHELLKVRGKGT